jgi:cell shape-determining protein MreD
MLLIRFLIIVLIISFFVWIFSLILGKNISRKNFIILTLAITAILSLIWALLAYLLE